MQGKNNSKRDRGWKLKRNKLNKLDNKNNKLDEESKKLDEERKKYSKMLDETYKKKNMRDEMRNENHL